MKTHIPPSSLQSHVSIFSITTLSLSSTILSAHYSVTGLHHSSIIGSINPYFPSLRPFIIQPSLQLHIITRLHHPHTAKYETVRPITLVLSYLMVLCYDVLYFHTVKLSSPQIHYRNVCLSYVSLSLCSF